MDVIDGQRRVVIEDIQPQIDGGRYPVKRVRGDSVVVSADVYCDGHDAIGARLLYRPVQTADWTQVPLQPLGNDRWRARFTATELGLYEFTIQAWVDAFRTWQRDLAKKLDADQDVGVDLQAGAELIKAAAERAQAADDQEVADQLDVWAAGLVSKKARARRIEVALSEDLLAAMDGYADRSHAVEHQPPMPVSVDRPRARFSSWFELFPRSCTEDPEVHGTFASCQGWLPRIASMGFDVVYLPPIHPIGSTHRKGPNNVEQAGQGALGSPWAIGSADGGHKSVHPKLGTLADFREFVAAAEAEGLEVALDLAYQCSPDHPYVQEHPSWFRQRPDGSIQYAENPPKKYQDIFPFDFESDHWRALWDELKSIVDFWIEQGVKIFRVDNPHTKPFLFWDWLIGQVRQEHPDVIFLAEAFTRPKVMQQLAKLGFSQSYTYFTWRNSGWELREYMRELTATPMREYFRPNFWPNTPDILTATLQTGGPPAFRLRLALAATLAANYGLYGAPYLAQESRPLHEGSEEYFNSEKYQIRVWDLDAAQPMADFVTRVNRIRHEHQALQRNDTLAFHGSSNDQVLAYSKRSMDPAHAILVVANMDLHHAQSGWIDLDLEALGLEPGESFQVHDLLGGDRYLWHGPHNYVELDPHHSPAHIFRVRRHLRTEHDFEYYL
ncbi:MAG: alpha-1,4-glucan--maltose-1-phosphate maltosyltransferase [Anaerolineales bacterium]